MSRLPNRKEAIEAARSQGLKIAAVLPFHYPRALLRAHGFHPVEIWGPPHVDDMTGTPHFPEYTCKIVQKATTFLLSPAADCVDLVLMPHTCDSLQGMASVFQEFLSYPKPVLTLYHPRGRRNSDRKFLEAELRILSQQLSKISGMEESELGRKLEEEMAAEDQATALMAQMLDQRDKFAVTDREFYTCLRSREYLPPHDFLEGAKALPRGKAEQPGVGIMISGILPEPMEIFDHINAFGAHVVADDLACVGRRCYPTDPMREKREEDPFVRLARQYTAMPADSTVSTPFRERFSALTRTMEDRGARAMLVYNTKFCEPELFYLPMLKQAIQEKKFGFLEIEMELDDKLSQTVLNRINAFIEVIS
ncbi:MAG: 2-hydroxyacyl-CoA dehydratase family protein [Desulfobacterales bacterium]|nr:2-hydroxyacyl-CoA dehydratase family protein [Desulfobacterales bacterium]